MTRISIFIDGANFLYGIRSINSRYSDFKFDFEKFIKSITKHNELINTYYYNASLKQNLNSELFKQQQKFFDRLRKINKFKVILCKRQRRTKNGEDTFVIKGDDIHLAIDMLSEAYENQFDTAILINGDGDFAPLVKQINNLGKKVNNYHFANNISLDLLKECNNNTVINKKIVNKFFFREEQLTLGDVVTGKNIKKLFKK